MLGQRDAFEFYGRGRAGGSVHAYEADPNDIAHQELFDVRLRWFSSWPNN